MSDTARRYVAVCQEFDGYPAADEPPPSAPPEGPRQPMMHSVVLEDDYAALAEERDELRDAARRLLAAYEAEESEDGFPFNFELRDALTGLSSCS